MDQRTKEQEIAIELHQAEHSIYRAIDSLTRLNSLDDSPARSLAAQFITSELQELVPAIKRLTKLYLP